MMVTDLPWNKVSSLTQDSNYSSPQELKVTELKEQDKEKENLSEDALLVLILNLYQFSLLKKVNNKFLAWLIPQFQEDLVLKEPITSENFMVLKDNKERINQLQLLLLKRMLPEEHSRAKKIQLLQKDKKLLKFKD